MKKKIMITLVITSLIFTMGFTARITQTYGYQKDNNFHHGIDIGVPAGKYIITNRAGVITKAEDFGVYGLTVIIDIGDDVQVLYGHNSKVLVKEGDKVVVGQPIAESGSSGKSTGSHIHVEVRKNNIAIDPIQYLNEK